MTDGQPQSPRVSTMELRDYFRILWLRKWTVFIVFALVVGGVMYLSYRQTPIYESRVRLVVPQPPTSAVGIPTPARAIDLQTQAQIAASTAVAEMVTTQLPWAHDIPAEQLLREVSVAPLTNTSILLFVADDPEPQRAADLAHYFATSYLSLHISQALAPFKQQLASLTQHAKTDNSQLSRLGQPRANEPTTITSERTRIQADLQITQTTIAEIKRTIDNLNATTATAIIQDATVPATPVRPNHLRDALLGAIVGFALGVGAAFLRDYVDDSLRGVEDVERQAGATLIGVIPHVSAADSKSKRGADGPRRDYLVAADDPRAPATEAYRTLRTNLLFMSATGPLRGVLITSPLQGEGKTTTAANLAVVMAQAGQRVLLVGADLRRPALHRFFGLSNRVGLSNVLAGQSRLAEAVQDPGIKGLRILSGGPIPPNPAELLGSPAMTKFLGEVAGVTDWIIIDGPPVLGLADALVLSSLSDGVLMVVHEGTNRRVLAHARDQLGKVRSRLVGAVLNNFGPAFSYYYSDYYAYTSQYYAAAEPVADIYAAAEPPAPPKEPKVSRKERRRRRKEAESGLVEAPPEGAPPPAVSVPGEAIRAPEEKAPAGGGNGGQTVSVQGPKAPAPASGATDPEPEPDDSFLFD